MNGRISCGVPGWGVCAKSIAYLAPERWLSQNGQDEPQVLELESRAPHLGRNNQEHRNLISISEYDSNASSLLKVSHGGVDFWFETERRRVRTSAGAGRTRDCSTIVQTSHESSNILLSSCQLLPVLLKTRIVLKNYQSYQRDTGPYEY